jgi:hypothetical protein
MCQDGFRVGLNPIKQVGLAEPSLGWTGEKTPATLDFDLELEKEKKYPASVRKDDSPSCPIPARTFGMLNLGARSGAPVLGGIGCWNVSLSVQRPICTAFRGFSYPPVWSATEIEKRL